MANFEVNGIEELAQKLERMEESGEIARKMLEESAPILKEEIVKQAEPHKDSGDMVQSIRSTKAEMDAKGVWKVVVRPTGTGTKGSKIRNMEKMAYLEYGVRGRAATPIMRTSILNATPEVVGKMREVFRREAEG